MLVRFSALWRLLSVFALAMLVAPMVAVADSVPPPQHTLALPTDQVWTLLAGGLVPLASYVLNHAGPWCTEHVKAAVQVLVAAVAGGLTQAIVAGNVGFNGVTLQFVLTAVTAALFAHRLLWLPSGISARLGGGSNAQT
jgi:hypothetical protein